MNKNITELIGTYFLVLTIGLAGKFAGGIAPLAIGSMLMVMVYMGGPISGAHYNPAVTLAAWMRKKISGSGALTYMLFQVIGSFIAALTVYIMFHAAMSPPSPAPGFHYCLKPLIAEMIFTFALASVVLNVAMAKTSAGNNYFGMAIGRTVAASAFAAGPISGGAFNPSVAIGPTLMDTFTGGNSMACLWIYLVGPFSGGALAAIIYKVMNPDEE